MTLRQDVDVPNADQPLPSGAPDPTSRRNGRARLREAGVPGLVSIVIPAYQAEDFLADAIDSALGQTCADVEVIVVIDGATDASADIAKSYGPCVRVIEQPNGGLPVARNRGIAESHGEFVLFLDADDRLPALMVASRLGLLAEYPDAGAVQGEIREMTVDGSRLGRVPRAHRRQVVNRPTYILTHGLPIGGSLVRRAALDEVGDFDPTLRSCEDMDFFLRFLSQHSLVIDRSYPMELRLHPTSATTQFDVMLGYHERVLSAFARQHPSLWVSIAGHWSRVRTLRFLVRKAIYAKGPGGALRQLLGTVAHNPRLAPHAVVLALTAPGWALGSAWRSVRSRF